MCVQVTLLCRAYVPSLLACKQPSDIGGSSEAVLRTPTVQVVAYVLCGGVLRCDLLHRRDPIAALQARASSAVSARSVPPVYISPFRDLKAH